MRLPVALLLIAATAAGCGSGPTQPAPACTYTLSPATITANADGGTIPVSVATSGGCAWSAQVSVPWLVIRSGESGTGPGTMAVAILPNSSVAARMGVLTVGGQSVSVSQQGLACAFALAPQSSAFDSAGGAGSFEVSTSDGCSWTAVSNAGWLTVTAGGAGAGSGPVRFTAAPNPTTGSRSGTIAVADRAFVVTQTGTAGCSYAIDPDDENFGVAGGTGTVRVDAPAGCAWTASSPAAWLRVTAPGGGQGAGSGSVTYSVDASTEAGPRTGVLTIGDRSLVVTQAGTAACEYEVSPVAVSACVGATERTIDVATAQGCSWTARAGAAWTDILSRAEGLGPGTIRLRVSDNFAGTARNGLIEVRWPTATQGQNVTVSQSGCLYAVQGDTSFSADGGSRSLWVYSTPEPYCGGPFGDACVWTARSDVSWITVTTAMPRNGDDQVFYTVAANVGSQARAGTITIASRVVVVSQAGR